MVAMNTKIFIVGLGDLGAVLLDLILRMPEELEVVVATRNVARAAPRCNLAQLGALAQGSLSKVRLIHLDLDDLSATAETIDREKPAVLISTATMATWWLPSLLPVEDAKAVLRAGFGVWLPVHLAPTLRLMRAVRQANFAGFVLTAPYPDAVNHVLSKIGLAPTSGIGNVAEMVPKIQRRAAEELHCSVSQISARFVAHHALGKYVFKEAYPEPDEVAPPFLLRVACDGYDVTEKIAIRRLVFSPEPIPEGRLTHLLTASSTIPLIRALLQDVPVPLHVPAPGGLPGGYPVSASRAGVELALGEIPLRDAVSVNEKSQIFDGISSILHDGTVVLADDNVRQLKSVLGECPRQIAISVVEEQAADLVARYQKYAEKRGSRSA